MPGEFQYGAAGLVAVMALVHLARVWQRLHGPVGRRDPRARMLPGRPVSIPCPDLIADYPELAKEAPEDAAAPAPAGEAGAPTPDQRRRAWRSMFLTLLSAPVLCTALLMPDSARDLSGWLDARLSGLIPPGREEIRPVADAAGPPDGAERPARAVELAWRERVSHETARGGPRATGRLFSAVDPSHARMILAWSLLAAPLPLLLLSLCLRGRIFQMLLALAGAGLFLVSGFTAREVSGARQIREEVAALRAAPVVEADRLGRWTGPVKTTGYPRPLDASAPDADVLSIRDGPRMKSGHATPFRVGAARVGKRVLESLEPYLGDRSGPGGTAPRRVLSPQTRVTLAGMIVNGELSGAYLIWVAPMANEDKAYDRMNETLRGAQGRHRIAAAAGQSGALALLLVSLSALLASMRGLRPHTPTATSYGALAAA